MNDLERRLRKRTWQENVKTTELYHLQKIVDDGCSWSERDTARAIGHSIGAVSENLRLSLALRIYPEVGEFKLRSDAVDWLKARDKCRSYPCREWSKEQIGELIITLIEELLGLNGNGNGNLQQT